MIKKCTFRYSLYFSDFSNTTSNKKERTMPLIPSEKIKGTNVTKRSRPAVAIPKYLCE